VVIGDWLSLNEPDAVAVDTTGNVYVIDGGNTGW
jgi:hypothetical protein